MQWAWDTGAIFDSTASTPSAAIDDMKITGHEAISSLTVSEPYHVLTKIVIGWELTLKPDGNVLFFLNKAQT